MYYFETSTLNTADEKAHSVKTTLYAGYDPFHSDKQVLIRLDRKGINKQFAEITITHQPNMEGTEDEQRIKLINLAEILLKEDRLIKMNEDGCCFYTGREELNFDVIIEDNGYVYFYKYCRANEGEKEREVRDLFPFLDAIYAYDKNASDTDVYGIVATCNNCYYKDNSGLSKSTIADFVAQNYFKGILTKDDLLKTSTSDMLDAIMSNDITRLKPIEDRVIQTDEGITAYDDYGKPYTIEGTGKNKSVKKKKALHL